ncbi:AcrR family transcriptional regulator [Paenibacillus shirakamiensis]|uniref:AcrR family transcriptional regulator n=1 Tax=Paenibacillus shirakamiensis TaxID=1265935 RepID=A0ABS4JEV3_9BACL|nr:TetR/AcrR family transcriptional regulator [Paenibacillus shirakamiensis]MBP2000244.1 AcrR family transcriptional regulator [Paenibacillus shirakamiensis]
MSIVKQTIMESAERYFSDKGYLETSIQDIVNDCSIAKGSFYKFFSSKTDLFIEIHLMKEKGLLEGIGRISAQEHKAPRDILIEVIEYEFQFFITNKFIMKELIELNVTDSKISSYSSRLRANILQTSRENLIRRFGHEIDPHIWDLVMIYSGIFHSYLFLLIMENRLLNIREVAEFIVDRVEDVVTGLLQKNSKPIIQNDIMSNYVHCTLAGESICIADQKLAIFEAMNSTIQELTVTNYRKSELLEAVVIVQKEMEQEQPQRVLLHAMLHFLAEEHDLKRMVHHLERFLPAH